MAIEPFRFLHTGDLHLDSPVTGLRETASNELLAVLREATTEAWRRIVRLALDERVDFVVVAGDVFERRSPTLLGQTRFRDGLAELAAAGIRSFVVHGNHDPDDGHSWAPSLPFPAEVHRFSASAAESRSVMRAGREIARVVGRSYPTAAVTENLAASYRAEPDAPFTVGVLHANVGDMPGHGNYAPCSVEDLRRGGIGYWALGHIHRPGILTQRGTFAVYCGIPQGRDPGEVGAHGAWLVEVDAAGHPDARFVACDVVRWELATLPIEALADDEALARAVRERLAAAFVTVEGRSLLLRMTLTGRGALHRTLRRPGYVDDLRRLVNEDASAVAPFAWLESIVDLTRPPVDVAARRAAPDFIGDFLRTVETARRAERGTDPEAHERWQASLRDTLAPLFDEWQRGRRHLAAARPTDEELFGDLLDEAETLGLDLLLAAEDR